MPENHEKEKAAEYRSICDVHADNGLGCGGCVLKGYRECPKSDGAGPRRSANLYDPRINGTPHGRDVGGYKCWLEGDRETRIRQNFDG